MSGDRDFEDATTIGAEKPLLAGRYRVVRALGQGGMGSVWLAEDERLDGHPVAIKMLPSVLVQNSRAYRQLKQEALVSLKLCHPNIAAVRAFEEDNGNPFLVMDYIDGQSLDDLLGERDQLSEEETVRILGPVADALDYAHKVGVVHRDVKPGNVMIAKDGTPYVLDFGIAREIQETMTRVTGKNSSGTLMYMSPEQLHGAAPKPPQDVYSFAAMAYECLTGHAPFYRGQIEYQIDHDMPEPLPDAIRIGRQVMAGLAKTAEGRPSSCREVLKARRSFEGLYKVIDLTNGTVTHLDAVPSGGWTDEYKTTKLVMRRIEPGTFMMGSPPDEAWRDNSDDYETQHRVTLTKPYYIGVFEVTQGQWNRVMGNNPSYFLGLTRPVEKVSWEDCTSFCLKAGQCFRLPTEAEWEYACRAGTMTAYAGSLGALGWYFDNFGSQTHVVGTKRPNDWGLYDMHGNVWEWCSDCFDEYHGDETDPKGPTSGELRVYRGGSWSDLARDCRSASRDGYALGYRNSNLGFRLCCSAGPSR